MIFALRVGQRWPSTFAAVVPVSTVLLWLLRLPLLLLRLLSSSPPSLLLLVADFGCAIPAASACRKHSYPLEVASQYLDKFSTARMCLEVPSTALSCVSQV